jgi:hypothetical protein
MGTARAIEGQPGNCPGKALRLAQSRAEAESEYRPKLLPRMREVLRSRHYSRRTEQAYCHWVRRFIYFHRMRHPAEMAGGLNTMGCRGDTYADPYNKAQ